MHEAIPSWVTPYIGAPYRSDVRTGSIETGFNCWGLFAAVRRDVFGSSIDDYEGPLWTGKENAAGMAEAARGFAQRFTEIARGQEREGDAILLRMRRYPIHIGVVVAPGIMLHIEEECDACIERYTDRIWVNRIVAFYRDEVRA